MPFQTYYRWKQAEARKVCSDCKVQWPYQDSLAGKGKVFQILLYRELSSFQQGIAVKWSKARRQGSSIWGFTQGSRSRWDQRVGIRPYPKRGIMAELEKRKRLHRIGAGGTNTLESGKPKSIGRGFKVQVWNKLGQGYLSFPASWSNIYMQIIQFKLQ